MGRTLYQLADDYLELWELCIDEDADIQNVVSKMLAIDDLIDSKVANGIAIIKAGGKRPLKIDNEQLIPDSFKFNVPVVNKDALRSALESGQAVAGAHLEDRGKYLKIF